MKDQLHLRNKLEKVDFTRVIPNFTEPYSFGDRIGGFWTSTYLPGIGSEWLQEKVYKPWANVFNGYLFSVKNGARLYKVNSIEDEKYFEEFYSGDYNQLAEDYHGINLSSDYVVKLKEQQLKIRGISSSRFHGWGLECTWWFNVDYLELKRTFSGDEIQEMADRNI
ncbi:hypothetical protein [Siminovitchia sp. FSL W7-1587]|uniref:hypothetical protein n=1 Tax=Siminovitchia sp. FSL W7-1587 TaxID=2954699 RepID=UPI0030D0890A